LRFLLKSKKSKNIYFISIKGNKLITDIKGLPDEVDRKSFRKLMRRLSKKYIIY